MDIDPRASMIQPGVFAPPYILGRVADFEFIEAKHVLLGINPVDVVCLPPPVVKFRTFIVHGGLGDLAWVYSKLCGTGEKFNLIIAAGMLGVDYSMLSLRSLPFLKLLPQVAYASTTILDAGLLYRLSGLVSSSNGVLPPTMTYLSFNSLLDSGRSLDSIFPSLPTIRHFNMRRPKWAMREASLFLKSGELAFAVYPSSKQYYGGNNLTTLDWVDLIVKFVNLKPTHKVILMGAPWDVNLLKPLYDSLCAIGLSKRTFLMHDRDIAVSLEVLRRCEFLIGAVSGLTIIAEYQKIPTVHFYPKQLHEDLKLMGTWESDEMIKNGLSLSVKISDGVPKIFDLILKEFAPFAARETLQV